MNLQIRHESTGDRDAIRLLNQLAFDGDDEANLTDALREGGFVEVAMVAVMDGRIVGHILFSRVAIHTRTGVRDALSLAPMAVLPEHQRQGIGSRLVAAGLEACRELDHQIVLVLGHPEFYSRFGFSADSARRIDSPFGGGEAWMALELQPDALKNIEGRVDFTPPFHPFA